MLRSLLGRLGRRILRLPVADPFDQPCYGQEGEDMVLRRMFEGRPAGFYVDVGAHHPRRFSNTFAFYLRGWRGINVDATPGSMAAFRAERPRDVNLELGIADRPGELTFHRFNEPALNTFDPGVAAERDRLPDYHIVGRVPVRTTTLAEVLATHLPPATGIDFLTVDVEGLDLDVLRSNDWDRFRPAVVLVEDMAVRQWADIGGSAVTRFLGPHGYEPVASTVHTVFYRAAAGRGRP